MNRKDFKEIWKKMYAEQLTKERYEDDANGGRSKREYELSSYMHALYNLVRGYPIDRGFQKNSYGLKDVIILSTRYRSHLDNGTKALLGKIPNEEFIKLKDEFVLKTKEYEKNNFIK